MLTVKTFLKETDSKGIGLFAAESISVGTVWWSPSPNLDRLIPKDEADLYSPLLKEFLNTYATLKEEGGWYLCVDNARFVNHSDDPNTAPKDHAGPDGVGDWIASRDIAVGEEIVCDYRFCCKTCLNNLGFENKE